jgi:hypothetical protein
MQMKMYHSLEFTFLLLGSMSLSLGIPAECNFRYDLRKLLNSADANLDQDDYRVVNQERNPEQNSQDVSTPVDMAPSRTQLGVNRIHGPPP